MRTPKDIRKELKQLRVDLKFVQKSKHPSAPYVAMGIYAQIDALKWALS